MNKYSRGVFTNILHVFSDCLFTFLYFNILYSLGGAEDCYNRYFVVYISFLVIYILFNFSTHLYNLTTFFYTDRILKIITTSYLIAMVITYMLCFVANQSTLDINFYKAFLIVFYVAIISSTIFMRLVMKRSNLNLPRTILVGKEKHFVKFKSYLEKSNLRYNILGYVAVDDECKGRDNLGKLDELEDIIRKNMVDQVFIMHRKSYHLDINPYVNICMEMGTTVKIIMNAYKPVDAKHYISNIGTYPILTYHRVNLGKFQLLGKRIMDIAGALVGIIISSPIMIVTAIAIKIDSRGPVIFKQRRVGRNGRLFYMYKFRSMCTDAEEKKQELMEQNEMESNLMFKIKDDPRITRVGKFIRKTSIDELPQFFNVLIGNMSLVGTRPPTVDEVDQYERYHWRRISIKPGITGMWQVSGRSSITDFDEIVELDTEYIDNWSIFLDIKILIKTVFSVLGKKDDAY